MPNDIDRPEGIEADLELSDDIAVLVASTDSMQVLDYDPLEDVGFESSSREVVPVEIDPTFSDYKTYYSHRRDDIIHITFDPDGLWRGSDDPHSEFYNWIHIGGYPNTDIGGAHLCSLKFAVIMNVSEDEKVVLGTWRFNSRPERDDPKIRIGRISAFRYHGRQARSIDFRCLVLDRRWDNNSNHPDTPGRFFVTRTAR